MNNTISGQRKGCNTLACLSLLPSIGWVFGCYGKTLLCCNSSDTCHYASDENNLPLRPVHVSSDDTLPPSCSCSTHLVWDYCDAQLIIWETADNVRICLSAWIDVRCLSPSCGPLWPCTLSLEHLIYYGGRSILTGVEKSMAIRLMVSMSITPERPLVTWAKKRAEGSSPLESIHWADWGWNGIFFKCSI